LTVLVLERIEKLDAGGRLDTTASYLEVNVEGVRFRVAPRLPDFNRIGKGDLIDVEGERLKLQREVDKALGDLEATKKKLMNQDFLAKARPDVVQREKDRLELLDQTVSKLKRALEALRG